MLSSTDSSIYTSLTSLPATTRQPSISGQSIPFTIINDYTLSFNLPSLSAGNANVRFIPYNVAGYAFSDVTLETQTYSGNSTFIIVE